MKLAILSDIHGNLPALEAVLADIDTRGIDRIVNLGDSCSGPLLPEETADRLMSLVLPTVRGNHERQLLELAPEQMNLSDRYTATRLRPDQRDWIATLPDKLRLSPELLLVHGTPDSDLAYFLETVTEQGLRPATMTEIQQRTGDSDATVILCGHTHIARVVQLADGRLIVNPGSVGLPAYADDHPWPHLVESGSPHARYATLTDDGGRWTAELHAVNYDWEQAAQLAEARQRPDWAYALRTGRAFGA